MTKRNYKRKMELPSGQWFRPVPTVLLYSNTNNITSNLALFDLDWTLIRSQGGFLAKDPHDVFLLPGRREKLEQLIAANYTIVIISNQSRQSDQFIMAKVERFAQLLGLPVYVFVARGQDEYRKPNVGIAGLINQLTKNVPINTAATFFVGDAAGRPQDFSDSDLKWARSLGILFYTPEQFFPQMVPAIPPPNPAQPTLIVLVGMPGSGKSTFYQQQLQPLGYVHISQDILGTKAKVLQAFRNALVQRQSIVIDRTNPTVAERQEFYGPALQQGYQIITLQFTANGEGFNKLREKPVSRVVYNVYFSKLEPPTSQNSPGLVYQL